MTILLYRPSFFHEQAFIFFCYTGFQKLVLNTYYNLTDKLNDNKHISKLIIPDISFMFLYHKLSQSIPAQFTFNCFKCFQHVFTINFSARSRAFPYWYTSSLFVNSFRKWNSIESKETDITWILRNTEHRLTYGSSSCHK